MSSLQQGSRFLPFSNNNIQRKQLSMQGGLPQSLSGSETDVSTSNENLTNEDRYVIRHTARQEPQGQENQQQSPSRSSSHKENIPNIQGNLLNRNSLKDSLNGSNRNSLKENLNGSNRNSLKDSINGSNRNSLKDNLSNRTSVGSNRSSLDVSTSSYNTLIIHNANDDNSWIPSGRLSGVVREHGDVGYLYCDGSGKGHSNSPTMQSLSNLSHEDHVYEQPNNGGCQEITDIPDDYLSQSQQVLKHLAKEVKVPSYSKLTNNGGNIDVRVRDGDRGKQNDSESEDRPPPSYMSVLLPLKNKSRLLGPMEKLTLSRSQPDLSRIGKPDIDNYNLRATSPRPQTKGREETESGAGEIWPPSEMIQIVIQENSALKLELERCYSKVAKSQKLEQEIAKVHRAHEELAASSERREKLERAARLRLQNDCRRLTELNRALRDQIDLLSARTDSPPIVESMRKELTQRELLIGQLITQNKELAAAKERQEIELAAQRATLQEQRTHIDILDTALTNAQGNVVRLEEECRKKQVYVERVGQLQRALSSLQASSDRREETERQLRGQLERELREGGGGGGGGGVNGNEQSSNGETIAELKRRIRERDEKIMSLEGDVAKWEQRYLEESALRQAAIDAASLPKDAKIAALEKTSQDAEKLIAEARSEKMRHMDEVHAAQKKLADLESRMKDLESKLAERDAMIRVLQKHTYDKDSSSSSGVGSYPAAHSSHSSTSADHHTALTSTPELVSSVLGGGSGYGSTGSYGVTDSYKYRKQGSFEQTNKSLDDQLKELDSQLLSKRALCCFPGFSNPGTASRKGKIPKPLLAGVDSTGTSSTASSKSRLLDDSGGEVSPGIMEFSSAASRLKGTVSRLSDGKPEDMMLLEKQGRSSQRQRMQEGEPRRAGSLPPSSLPRPPKNLKSTGSRYCRLSDTETRKKSDPGPALESGGSIKVPGSNCSIEYGRFDTKTQRRKKSSGSEPLVPSSSLKKPSSAAGHEYERLQAENIRKKQSSSSEAKLRDTQSRSLIPPPSRRIGEYGRLSDGTLRKQTGSRGQSTGSTVSSKSGGRDSGGTASSEASTSSLPPSKARSIPRPSNYRIQF
ncbi:angiomotin-like protein 1 isoform X1 [Osmia bicornis bicornis]|uniref:angiomotin-like protein 1 isoform X1 n=1 Tax=Osmia bicornis bicornis TaxID=1437191 RepID=UPI0010F76954|nr:angiomotin-like protein 1 isoform X1 [Osmia bicornis bicornis]XP_029035397.1 angiomotin-like protein 1 isoform X1 [Osmia bicornis bicornis]XP_029035399.1 angiomotin-like protein 1 isoform X1 [Osmia bicornis bicornis]